MKYETLMLEQFKRHREIIDQELAITAAKFLNNPWELYLVEKALNKKKGVRKP